MNEAKKCSSCGATIGSDAPEGLCPGCLLALNLRTQTEPLPDKDAAGPAPAPSIQDIGKAFPQLEVVEFVGRGGMGIVYKARQPRLNRFVALKILSPEASRQPHFAERFEREAQALARLSHPNIVTVYDFGEYGGHFYLMMEFVDGTSLRDLLRAGHLPPEQAFSIVPKICDALQYAHEQGIVHRDIKPENILLDGQGRLKIADFGIAKLMVSPGEATAAANASSKDMTLTGEGNVIGTPNYMAPEQIEKPHTVDHRADIYSLGVVFYEMLTGELPIGKFQPPSQKVAVDVRMDHVILRSLEKQPERRYQHASEVKSGVETITNSRRPASASASPRPARVATYALVASIAFIVLVVGGIGLWQILRNNRPNPNQVAQEGWQLWQSGRPTEAVKKFEQAVKLQPDNVNAWNGLGWASVASGKATDAEKAFQKAVSLEPTHPAALNGLGQICLMRKQYAAAEGYLLKAAPRASAASFGLARIYLLQDNFGQAEKWAREALSKGEKNEVLDQMLKAAVDKKVNDQLRRILTPPD